MTEPARTEDWRSGGFGIYVHWPFCAAKCPYCDFNSHVRTKIDQDRWRSALVSEINRHAALLPGRRVETVFFGGGTPSLMPPATVAAVIDAIARGWDLASDAEITLEANPTSVEARRFAGYRLAGVNRLSLGVQALNDPDLRALGRMHSASEALAALALARDAFPRISFDLIYARQNQTPEAWRAELRTALDMAPDHLSLYQLTIEDGTRFGDLARRGRLRGLPDANLSADLYILTQSVCDDAGLPAYELSNHARRDAGGRHNLIYWRYGDYVGVGPGAHGRLSHSDARWATEALRRPEDWLMAVETASGQADSANPISSEDQAVEMMIMGLRLSEGVRPERFSALAGRPLSDQRISELMQDGLIDSDGGALRATPAGRMVLNTLIEAILR